MRRMRRPVGILVLAVLQVVSGLQLLFLSVASFVIAAVLSAPGGQDDISTSVDVEATDLLVAVFLMIGVAALILAVLSFLLARGYLRRREWSRRKGRQVALLAIVVAVVNIVLVPQRADPGAPVWTVLFNVVVYLYLGRGRIRAYFGH